MLKIFFSLLIPFHSIHHSLLLLKCICCVIWIKKKNFRKYIIMDNSPHSITQFFFSLSFCCMIITISLLLLLLIWLIDLIWFQQQNMQISTLSLYISFSLIRSFSIYINNIYVNANGDTDKKINRFFQIFFPSFFYVLYMYVRNMFFFFLVQNWLWNFIDSTIFFSYIIIWFCIFVHCPHDDGHGWIFFFCFVLFISYGI